MTETTTKNAGRQYMARIVGSTVVYAIAVVVSIRGLQHNSTAPWKYGLALLPVFPALFIPVAVVDFFRKMDEMQQRIQLEALAFGFTAAAVLTLSYGFLQNAGLPAVNWIWVWPVMGVCWALGLAVAKRRYL